MSASVVAIVLFAALLHASWKAIDRIRRVNPEPAWQKNQQHAR